MKMTPATTKSVHRTILVGIVLLVIIMVLLISVGWFYILKISVKVNRYNTEISTIRLQTEKLAELSWRYQKVIPQKSVVKEAIPDSKDESTFMADLENLAKKHSLSITNSKIGTTQAKKTKSGAFSQTLSKGDYFELPIRYEMRGQYSEFVNFVSELSTLRRLNSINDISVTADFSDKKVTGNVKSAFVVTIYIKK